MRDGGLFGSVGGCEVGGKHEEGDDIKGDYVRLKRVGWAEYRR